MRSLLGAPAHDRKSLSAAICSHADVIVPDLEDSVPPLEKERARANAADFIDEYGQAFRLFVRLNGCETGLHEADVDAVVRPGLAGIQIPKVESARDVRLFDRLVAAAERLRRMPLGSVEVVATIESALGVRRAHEIASASRRVAWLMPAIGEDGDLQRDLGYVSDPAEFGSLYARSQVLLAARAAGPVDALDGAYVGLDEAGFVRSATIARRLGYRGKKVVHVEHVTLANTIFDSAA